MGALRPVVTTAVILLVTTFVSGWEPRSCPRRVVIVEEGTPLEERVVEQFVADDYDHVLVPELNTDRFLYEVNFSSPIRAVYLIAPTIKFFNGTVAAYQDGVEFSLEVQERSVAIWFQEVGYFMLTISTGESKENILLSVGMGPSCDTVCQAGAPCKGDEDELPRDVIECPPSTECQLVSGEVASTGEPVGDAVVVETCDEFIEAVCDKFEDKGGKVDVYFNGHGNQGRFFINDDKVEKDNECYSEICEKLRGKIKTLTLYTCSTAGGEVGTTFVKCLANCLNATVRAWQKTLYTRFFRFLFLSGFLRWSTQRGFTEPVEAMPRDS